LQKCSLLSSERGTQPRPVWFGSLLANFRERLPTFMCVVQVHILDDTHKGGRGWLENASPLKMAVEESPLGPL
jgi:hypothetical protein